MTHPNTPTRLTNVLTLTPTQINVLTTMRPPDLYMLTVTPPHLTNVLADSPPGKVAASESQVAIPAPQPPSTPEMTPAAVARAQVMDIAIGTTWGQ